MDGKRITLSEVLINYKRGSFMDVVDFIIKTSSMTHPDYWTIIKL